MPHDRKARETFRARPPTLDLPRLAISITNNNVPPKESITLTRAQAAKIILGALQGSESILGQLQAAASRPLARYPVAYDTKQPFNNRYPHVPFMHHASRRLYLRGLCNLALTNTSAAYQDLLLVKRISETFETDGPSHLFSGIIIDFHIAATAWAGVEQWSSNQIGSIQSFLLSRNYAKAISTALMRERARVVAASDYMSKHDLKYLLYAFDGGRNSGWADAAIARLVPKGWFDFEKAYYYDCHEKIFVPFINQTNITFNLPSVKREADKWENEKKKWLISKAFASENMEKIPELALAIDLKHRTFAFYLFPGLLYSPHRAARAQTSAYFCVTALALELYKRQNVTYPETLATLIPNFITKLPHDPLNGGPLLYRKSGDSYLLYSAGVNGIDDAGKAGKQFEHLDIVW